MSDSSVPSTARSRHPLRSVRSSLTGLLVLLAVVLSLNLVLPGGLGAVASVLPGSDEPSSAQQEATSTPDASDSTNQQSSGKSTADIAEQANPAVVTIYSKGQLSNDAFGSDRNPVAPPNQGGDQHDLVSSIGSGFIIDEDGHVVTNSHVVSGGTDYVVELYDGTHVDATLVGMDEVQDIAVLQLDLSDGQTVPGTLSFGDSDAVRPGDPVVAIGTPLGEFTNSVSAGIIGGVDRQLNDGLGGSLDNLIQHDAPISSGNSGGPLLNSAGEVIGINTATATASGLSSATAEDLNFAIASNAAKPIVDELIANGSVSRPYLGIEGQLTQDGHYVGRVEDGSPAADAGLQDGDIITEFDGQAVDADHSLQSLLYQHKPGDTVEITVERGNDTETLQVTLGERPSSTQ